MTKKIVVADDSTTIRGVAESLLRQRGYEVYTAPEGEAAFSLIEKIHPDLVLLDYSMPEPNGLDLCKRMRDKGEYKETPIIILANAGDSDKIMDFVECGATGTLVKPFTPRELNETVDDYFTRDSAEESESVKADIEMQHSLIGIDDGQNVNKDSADPSDSSEDLHEEAIKEFAKSDSSLSESSFALMEQKGDSDELDFSWSDLSLDLEEFVNEDEDSASIDDRLLSDKQSSNDDTDSITRFLDSSEKPPEMEGNMPHDYNWFINEMRKEIKDTDNTVADSEKLNTSDSDDVDAAQDVSAESSQIGVKATEQYEEFISAFRDDIRGITESDQESPEIPIEEYPSAEEVLSTQDDKSIDIEPEITEEEDFILSDHEPLAVGDIQIDDSQITDEDELSEIPEEFTKLELPEDSEEQVLQEEETFSDEKQEVQDSVAEDIETEPLTEALERDRE
ncbi:MAG: response regulator, partial [candidate division Zixibacteria bacterium]|nr:response regulator [candidate division Zixibacteria bacterium]